MAIANKEEIRMLVQDVGYKEAAWRLGINYATLRKMGSRGRWNQPILDKRNLVTTLIKPSDAQANILEERKNKSKLSLSHYVTLASADAEIHPQKLEITSKAKDLASIHSTLWPEREQVNAGVMGGLKVYSNQTVIAVQTKTVDKAVDNTDQDQA